MRVQKIPPLYLTRLEVDALTDLVSYRLQTMAADSGKLPSPLISAMRKLVVARDGIERRRRSHAAPHRRRRTDQGVK